MKLEGIHHITAITGDAPGNVDFYARVLGLRLVKKTVNQDDPTVYHLFYADELGQRRQRHHVLRVPRRAPRARRARDGAPRRLARRLRGRSTSGPSGSRPRASSERGRRPALLRPRGARARARRLRRPDEPLVAELPEIPREHALQGFHGVRAYAADPDASRRCSRTRSASSRAASGWEVRGDSAAALRLRRAAGRARDPGAGTVHHVAWASLMEEHEAWRERAARRRAADARDRPLLLPLDLLPRAERRAVRDRDHRARLHDRRAARDARRGALAAARLRARPPAGRAGADAALEPAPRDRRSGEPRLAPHRIRPAAAEPEGALVLFHGRGADEHDLDAAARRARPGAAPARRDPARRSRCRPAARTGTSSRASATPTRRPSTRRYERPRRGSTRSPRRPASRPSGPCSAASRRAR